MNTTHQNKDWLVFTEINDWEGESWNFYFPKTENNIKAFDTLKTLMAKVDEYGETVEFGELSDTSEKSLNSLRSGTGYMSEHNVYDKELDLEKVSNLSEADWDENGNNPFYKGGISDFIK